MEKFLPGSGMQNRQRKIAVFGAMLIAASFLVGLLHSFLPQLVLNLAGMSFDLFVFFCYGLSGIIFLGLATVIFAISAVFLNPVGVMFLLGTLWLVISRKPSHTT